MKGRLIIVMSLLMCLCGCTQYNGHIGAIFGSWSLVEITEDGSPLQLDGETVFSFQNELVQVVKTVDFPMSPIYRYGNFEKTDNTLILKFKISATANGNYSYMTPNWMYLPLDEPSIPMKIKELNGGKMVLVLNSDSKILQYTFSRTW